MRAYISPLVAMRSSAAWRHLQRGPVRIAHSNSAFPHIGRRCGCATSSRSAAIDRIPRCVTCAPVPAVCGSRVRSPSIRRLSSPPGVTESNAWRLIHDNNSPNGVVPRASALPPPFLYRRRMRKGRAPCFIWLFDIQPGIGIATCQ